MARAFPAAFLLLAALASPAVAAPDAATASSYPFPARLEDAAGDAALVATGQENPESDILLVEMTDDPEGAIIRVTMQTLSFTAPAGNCVLTLQLTGPEGEAWEATAVYESGGAEFAVGADYSSGGAGDDDVPVPGLRGEAVPAEDAIYLFLDNAATGAAVGSTIEITSITMGRGAVLFSLSGVDAVDGSIDYVLSQAATGGVPAPATGAVSAVLNGTEATGNLTFAAATTANYTYSWDTNLTAADLEINATVGNGSAVLRVVDGKNATLVNHTISATGPSSLPIASAAPGNWSIEIAFTDFVGNLTFRVGAPPPAPIVNSTSETSTTTPATSKDSPPLGLPTLVALGIAGTLLARRRRVA